MKGQAAFGSGPIQRPYIIIGSLADSKPDVSVRAGKRKWSPFCYRTPQDGLRATTVKSLGSSNNGEIVEQR